MYYKHTIFALVLVTAVFLTACDRGEIPVTPVDRSGIQQGSVTVSASYIRQVWFDLSTNTTVSAHDKTEWDIAFDCSDTAHWVYLNTAKGMQAAPIPSDAFESTTSVSGLVFVTDHPSGRTDSLAFGDWLSGDNAFVLDLGYDENGVSVGYRKLLLMNIENNVYTFRYATLNNSFDTTVSIATHSSYNTIAYSVLTHQSLFIEPESDAFDLVFTQYMHLFYDPYTPYLVTGVLLNRSGVLQVAKVADISYENITSESITDLEFSSDLNAIGYDWKSYDFNAGVYSIATEITYIILDRYGYYYKLRFVDFYNDQGERGYPAFEYQLL